MCFSLSLSNAAHAQTSSLPASAILGRYMAEVHPLGVELLFDNNGQTAPVYKLGLAFAGKIAEPGRISVWLGGELNIGGVANFARIEPGLFVKLTFEKLMPVRLVPFVRFGPVGGIDVIYAGRANYAIGDFGFKFGGGAHYFVTRNIGIGLETDIQLGGRFRSVDIGFANLSLINSGFYGYWDLLAGCIFTF
jgi:hypothetical protein